MPHRLISDGALRPFVLQAVGVAGLVGLAAFWADTGRIEPTLIAAFGSLISLGVIRDAAKRYTREVNGGGKPPEGGPR